MSTVITNAYYTQKNLTEVFTMFRVLREREQNRYRREVRALYDDAMTQDGMNVPEARKRLYLIAILESHEIHCGLNGSPESMAYLYPPLMGGHLRQAIVHFPGVSRANLELTVSENNLGNYEYYNNTDRPEGITRQAWETRHEVWGKILPTWTPRRDGASYELITKRDAYEIVWQEFRTVLNSHPLLPDEQRIPAEGLPWMMASRIGRLPVKQGNTGLRALWTDLVPADVLQPPFMLDSVEASPTGGK